MCFEVLGEWSEGWAVGAVEVCVVRVLSLKTGSASRKTRRCWDTRRSDVNIGGDIAGGVFFIPDELEDLLTAWFGEDGECVDHAIILVYTKI